MTAQPVARPDYGVETFALFDHVDRAATTAWRVPHGLSFFVGGSTFIAGSVLYFYPTLPNMLVLSGLLYIIGSLGFLLVDVMEFFTYTDNRNKLRTNIALSMIGSTAYVIGSIGFLPDVAAANKVMGPWGFIIGSAFIFASQSWKVLRIVSEDRASGNQTGASKTFGFRPLGTCARTGIGVEADAGLGGLMFLIGTIMYVVNPAALTTIIVIWVLGSVFFTVGSLFLNYRHFVMKLCR